MPYVAFSRDVIQTPYPLTVQSPRGRAGVGAITADGRVALGVAERGHNQITRVVPIGSKDHVAFCDAVSRGLFR